MGMKLAEFHDTLFMMNFRRHVGIPHLPLTYALATTSVTLVIQPEVLGLDFRYGVRTDSCSLPHHWS